MPPHFLADQLTLSQPGGAHSPHQVLQAPLNFQILRRPCKLNIFLAFKRPPFISCTFFEGFIVMIDCGLPTLIGSGNSLCATKKWLWYMGLPLKCQACSIFVRVISTTFRDFSFYISFRHFLGLLRD